MVPLESSAVSDARVAKIRALLKRAIPHPRCELEHASPWQLLVATILSAQSTDATINKVTPALFARFPRPVDLADADPAEVEALVKSTGFFRNKAKAIQGAARMLVAEFGGEVPKTMEEITRLPGVARKTGNVVLGVALGVTSGIVVDTHVSRVSQRLGLSQATDPEEVERELCEVTPRAQWIEFGHRLLLHGRYVCKAKAPACGECVLAEVCPSLARAE